MSSPSHSRIASRRRVLVYAALLAVPVSAAALLPPWMQHVRANAGVEAALYRLMDLPGARVFFPRTPKESIAELNKLPATPALYGLRAHQEEQALDFGAAEADWKTLVAKSPDHAAAQLQLADFYHRRLDIKDELATLLEVATTPPDAGDAFTSPANQQAWQAFERARALADAQSLDDNTVLAVWRSWITRYPQQPTVYARAFTWTLDQRRFSDSEAILAEYRAAFPADQVFPIKATALLTLRRGGVDAQAHALAVYDAAFQPLWPDSLVSSYFALLDSKHNLRHFIADANARLQRNPDDFNALGRTFLYEQHQNQTAAAVAALDQYRRSKEARNVAWTAAELDTLAQLSLAAHDAPNAARYDFALYSTPGQLANGQDAKATGLSKMIALLLSTPDQAIELGAGNLSMYRDIATLDRGPGYWNGILSLWLNGQGPGDQFAEEEKKAQPYFERAKAAELLTLLDREAPSAPQRPALHAQLLQVYADYGDNTSVVREGSVLLKEFPQADARFRLSVAMTMAGAYARQNDTASEFALYDRTLEELGPKVQKMPLTAASLGHPAPADLDVHVSEEAPTDQKKLEAAPAFQLDTNGPTAPPHPEADAYAQVLDRYLGRLTSAHKLPEALGVLRKELDRNPDDPLLYEKLADFLAQNNLTGQQEEVYQRAIERFQAPTWTDKLARFYLRQKRVQDYAALTRKVTDTFEGTDVDAYFARSSGGGPELSLQLNLYAHSRFPHDVVFTQNLLNAYSAKPTIDSAAWEKLLRETWWQTPDFTRRFFEFLTSTGKLDGELAQLQPAAANPAAQEEAADAELWRSHFEQSAPLFAELSAAYPADAAIGTTASDLQRSLAWFDPERTATSIAIEQRLLAANPGDTGRLARIGDILADHADDSAASLAPAALYWRRMPAVAPGDRDNYLQTATIFWDYFQFDDALAEIAAARSRFHEPALYSYEAGAIAEGKRDYNVAVREYIAGALADPPDDGALVRLRQLALRAATHELVDTQTAAAASSGTIEAVTLRLDILSALKRSSEAAPVLAAALKAAKTSDAAAEIAGLAQGRGLPDIYEQALAREADLTTDPLERLQLRYTLVRAYKDGNDIAAASRLSDQLYHENPMLLGVVRSTVDFDWTNKRQSQAVSVLVAAAHAAEPGLAHQFTAEAAEKANASGDTRQGRSLAESLLQLDPYSPQYLSLAADSYARADDNTGLKQFYLTRLDALRSSPMAADERKAHTALLRKGLIPALTRAKDYAGAVAQYMALLSAYPEDSALNNEAALYALRYDRKQQLLDFLRATTKGSPRDARFFIDFAETQIVFGDVSDAIDAYAHAIAIRRDRVDLYTAKASLEETLQRFDDAAADYQRLYQLSYKDSAWMVAIARTRARQGRGAEAVAALKTAYLTGPKQVPHDFFVMASQLEQWNMLDDAASFAEQGRTAAGSSFLTTNDATLSETDPVVYARILTRARRAGAAFGVLRDALAAAQVSSASPGIIQAQVQSRGIASVTDTEWRKQTAAAQMLRAKAVFAAAVNAAGAVVDNFYTPVERAAFAAELEQQRTDSTPKQLADVWIPAAHAAGLSAKEAAWRKELLLRPGDGALQQVEPYSALERSRFAFEDLGQGLEAFIKLHPKSAAIALTAAADAYRSAGDTAAETRVLRVANLRDDSQAPLRGRYLELLLQHDRAALLEAAASRNEGLADAAANLAMEEGPPALALDAVSARGRTLPAVWTPATAGLAYLFFADTTGKGDAAFRTALASDATIAERLATQADTAQQLTGEPWFYYAARDGQLRLAAPATRDSAEELLAADLEYSANAASYSALAQTYVEAGNAPAALAELDHVLELDPNAPEIHDARAVILWNSGRKEEAVAAWRAALASLRVVEDRAAAPESFWVNFAIVARHLHEHGLSGTLKTPMDDLLRVYMARNGNYRSSELLRAAFASSVNPAEGAEWVLSLASAAVDPLAVLQGLDNAGWLTLPAREIILLREIQLARAAIKNPTDTYDVARQRMFSSQDSLIALYAARHEDARALALLRSLDASRRGAPKMQQTEAVLAARSGGLDALLVAYRSKPDTAPPPAVLRDAAAELARSDHQQQARALLEFSFDSALSTHTLASTDYLALADARLRTGDLDGAITLLNTLAETSGDTYANLDSAAALLEKAGHPAEAIAFLSKLACSTPWELTYKVRLAEAQLHSKQSQTDALASLTGVARNPLASYALRARAARDLSGSAHADVGGGELSLLASPTISPLAAQQPFFLAARTVAAEQSREPKQQVALLREAVAIAPATQALLLDLFRAEIRAGDAPGTRAAMEALLKAPSSAQDDFTASSDIASDFRIEDYPTIAGQNYAPQPAIAASLPAEERATLVMQFAEAYRHADELQPALTYYRLALHFAPKDSRAPGLRASIVVIEAEQRLEAANAVRRPVIHKTLDQAAVVRSRLTSAPDDAAQLPEEE